MTFEQKIKAKLTITFCKVPFLVTRIIVMIYVQFKVYSRFIYFPNAPYVFFLNQANSNLECLSVDQMGFHENNLDIGRKRSLNNLI